MKCLGAFFVTRFLSAASVKTIALVRVVVSAADVQRQNREMPGDGKFGFFSKPGYCRLRIRMKCSFKVASTYMRNTIVEVRIKTNTLRHRTDDDGVFDVKFKCDPTLHKEKTIIAAAGTEHPFILEEAPADLKFPDNKCNVDLNF